MRFYLQSPDPRELLQSTLDHINPRSCSPALEVLTSSLYSHKCGMRGGVVGRKVRNATELSARAKTLCRRREFARTSRKRLKAGATPDSRSQRTPQPLYHYPACSPISARSSGHSLGTRFCFLLFLLPGADKRGKRKGEEIEPELHLGRLPQTRRVPDRWGVQGVPMS